MKGLEQCLVHSKHQQVPVITIYYLPPLAQTYWLVQEPLEGAEQKSSTPSTHAALGKGLSNGGLDPVCPQPPLSQNPQGNFFKYRFPHLPQNY